MSSRDEAINLFINLEAIRAFLIMGSFSKVYGSVLSGFVSGVGAVMGTPSISSNGEIRDKIETEINKMAEEIMPNLEMQIREKFKFDKGNKDKDFKTLLNVFNALDAKTINEGLKLAKNIGKDMNGLVDEPSQKTWKNAVISLLESGGKTSSSFKLLLDWMAKIERSLQ